MAKINEALKEGKVGNPNHYYTYDLEPDRMDGKYHVGEGGTWGWQHRGVFKSARGAKNWAVKRNGGREDYHD